MESAALGASSARPAGHSRGLGTAASIVGAAQKFALLFPNRAPPPAGGEVGISKSRCKAKFVAVVGAVM